MNKAVILAGGLGTRMRKRDASASLTNDQAQVAQTGVKAMIPIDRPFLDYVITVLADAGYRRLCLVIGPGHGQVRDYYTKRSPPRRVAIQFAVQQEPRGTADAVAAAQRFVGEDPFLMINSDNYYPLDAVRGLRTIEGPGLAGFEKHAMIDKSNIPADRVLKFAAADIDPDGYLRCVIEKPTEQDIASLGGGKVYLSMNCWRFTPNIFEACRKIKPSTRGELEVTDAVQHCIDHLGERFRVLKLSSAVLDLSSQQDVGPVTQRLGGTEVRL